MTRQPAAQMATGQHAPNSEHVLKLFLTQLVSLDFGIDPDELKSSTRSARQVARARQTAMYLAHTTLSFSLERAGRMFDRDRSTAAHACHTVEDLRDQPGFDDRVAALEGCLRQLTQFIVGSA